MTSPEPDGRTPERALTTQALKFPSFFVTAPQPCPYLPGREERKIFTELKGEEAAALHDALSRVGFRRSQNIAYRPACEGCGACVSVRVLTAEFRPTRRMRRIMRRNRDLVARACGNVVSAEQHALLERYLAARHAEGGMLGMSFGEYREMVQNSPIATTLIEYRRRRRTDADAKTGKSVEDAQKAGRDTGIRDTGSGHRAGERGSGDTPARAGDDDGELLAVALTDWMEDGLSMVYSFFAPEESRRSLGTFMILDHIERARAFGLPHLYLGYWIEESPKMAYKAHFRPFEILIGNQWRRMDGNGGRSPDRRKR